MNFSTTQWLLIVAGVGIAAWIMSRNKTQNAMTRGLSDNAITASKGSAGENANYAWSGPGGSVGVSLKL